MPGPPALVILLVEEKAETGREEEGELGAVQFQSRTKYEKRRFPLPRSPPTALGALRKGSTTHPDHSCNSPEVTSPEGHGLRGGTLGGPIIMFCVQAPSGVGNTGSF